MNLRQGASIVLLAFVAASVVYLATGSRRPTTDGTAGADPAAGRDTSGAPGSRVIAYYFHATMRCPTCLSIENGARAALESAFAAELASGAMEWRSANMEEPANEHFVTDFGLTASSLVLVGETAGGITRWSNLERVWDLVGDEALFEAYVVESARDFLAGA